MSTNTLSSKKQVSIDPEGVARTISSNSAVTYLLSVGLNQDEIKEIEKACMTEVVVAPKVYSLQEGFLLDYNNDVTIEDCMRTLAVSLPSEQARQALTAIRQFAAVIGVMPHSYSERAGNCVLAIPCSILPPAREDELKRLFATFGGRAVSCNPRIIFYMFESEAVLNGILVCLHHKKFAEGWASYTTLQFLIVFASSSVASSSKRSEKHAVHIVTPIQNFTKKVGKEVHVEI